MVRTLTSRIVFSDLIAIIEVSYVEGVGEHLVEQTPGCIGARYQVSD